MCMQDQQAEGGLLFACSQAAVQRPLMHSTAPLEKRPQLLRLPESFHLQLACGSLLQGTSVKRQAVQTCCICHCYPNRAALTAVFKYRLCQDDSIESVCGCAGITDKTEGGPFLLEARQGDTISGNVSRQELARLVVTALSTPEATGIC